MIEIQLPDRPKPVDCESLPFDAYSGMQMMAYGRACADAQKLADENAEIKRLREALEKIECEPINAEYLARAALDDVGTT
jgi:hypothetical protein